LAKYQRSGSREEQTKFNTCRGSQEPYEGWMRRGLHSLLQGGPGQQGEKDSRRC